MRANATAHCTSRETNLTEDMARHKLTSRRLKLYYGRHHYRIGKLRDCRLVQLTRSQRLYKRASRRENYEEKGIMCMKWEYANEMTKICYEWQETLTAPHPLPEFSCISTLSKEEAVDGVVPVRGSTQTLCWVRSHATKSDQKMVLDLGC